MNDSSERYNLICQKNAIHCKKHKNGIIMDFHGFDIFSNIILQTKSKLHSNRIGKTLTIHCIRLSTFLENSFSDCHSKNLPSLNLGYGRAY